MAVSQRHRQCPCAGGRPARPCPGAVPAALRAPGSSGGLFQGACVRLVQAGARSPPPLGVPVPHEAHQDPTRELPAAQLLLPSVQPPSCLICSL